MLRLNIFINSLVAEFDDSTNERALQEILNDIHGMNNHVF